MERLISTIVLYLMLVVFALVGVFYLAPRIGEAVKSKLIQSTQINHRVTL